MPSVLDRPVAMRLGTGDTPASVISNYFGNQLLQNSLCANGAWLALHEDDPTVTGDPTTEIADTTRQRVTFADASGKAVVSNLDQKFTMVPASTVGWLALWENQVGGHMLTSIGLLVPIAITIDGVFLCAAGDIGVGL